MAWVIVVHVFGVILWLGSLLVIASMLGRSAVSAAGGRSELIGATRRLFNGAHAGALVTIVCGIILVAMDPVVMAEGWMHLKLGLVLLLIGTDLLLWRRMVALESHPSALGRGQFAILHGVISLLLLGILILVFVRPF
jgi:putative membrane protein